MRNIRHQTVELSDLLSYSSFISKDSHPDPILQPPFSSLLCLPINPTIRPLCFPGCSPDSLFPYPLSIAYPRTLTYCSLQYSLFAVISADKEKANHYVAYTKLTSDLQSGWIYFDGYSLSQRDSLPENPCLLFYLPDGACTPLEDCLSNEERYHCLECADFDLCPTCATKTEFVNAKGHRATHTHEIHAPQQAIKTWQQEHVTILQCQCLEHSLCT